MPIEQVFSSPDRFLIDLTKDLLNQSRTANSRQYIPFGQVSAEKNRGVRDEINRLIESQKGRNFDIIPFSITRSSKPIQISPNDLRRIIGDEEYARRVYESQTGHSNVSRNELADLKKRAISKYESSAPEIEKLESQLRGVQEGPRNQRESESRLGDINSRKLNLEKELSRLDSEKSRIASQKHFNPAQKKFDEITGKIHEIEAERAELLPRLNKYPDMTPDQQYNHMLKLLEGGSDIGPYATIIHKLKKLDSNESLLEAEISKLQSENPGISSPTPGQKRFQDISSKIAQIESEKRKKIYENFPSNEASRFSPEYLYNKMSSELKTGQDVGPYRGKGIIEGIQKLESQESALKSEMERLSKRGIVPFKPSPHVLSNEAERSGQLNREKELGRLDSERSRIASQIAQMQSERSGIESQLRGPSPAVSRSSHLASEYERANPEEFIKRASIDREINRLEGQGARIAPMNEWSERAINKLEMGFDDDTMELAANELRKAQRHSELGAVEPLLRASLEGPSDAYMQKYIDDDTKNLRKALEDESEEEYLKKIAPKINMSFSQMGAFHSGARAKALKDAASEHRLKLQREIARMTSGSRDKAMEHHELQKRREQSAANLLGHTTKSENEASRHNAEAFRHHAVTKHGMNQLDVAALGQVGGAKQQQEQNEIDVARQEHERQLLHEHEQLARQFSAIHGLPTPPTQTVSGSLSRGPTSPNIFNLGAGALGAAFGGFGQQQGKTYKKGGSVRKNYANGGPVDSNDIGNEIRNLIEEQRSSDKSRLEDSKKYNPLQDWLRHVSREMLSNPSVDPLLNLGRGSSNAMDHRELMHERSANLYDKIQSSRLNQFQVLAAYENMKHKQRFNDKQLDLQRERMNSSRGNSNQASQLKKLMAAKKVSPSERKTEIEAKKELARAIRMKKEVNHLGGLIEKTSTGPIVGGIKSILPKTKVDNQIEVATNKLILDMHQGMKNIPRSEEFMKRIETTKPNPTNYPEANKDALSLMEQGANDVEEHSISTLLSMGWTPARIEKHFKVKVPGHFLDGEEEEFDQEVPEEKNETIQMISPDGKRLKVPLGDVKEALGKGAVYA